MKRFFLILVPVIGTFVLSGCGDDDLRHPDNPTVEDAFTAKYAGATGIDWEKKGDYWVANFRKDAKDMEAWFGNDGEWYLTETDIPFDALPEAVKTAFSASEYQAWHIDDIDMVERKGMETVYVLEVEKGDREYDLYYSSDGTLLKAVGDSNDDDDNGKYLPTELSEKIKVYISANYPQAKILEIESEKGMIEVDILDGTVHRELLFDASGEWTRTETEIRKNDIPQNIMSALNASEYASYTIDDVYYCKTPQRNYYYFELESQSQDVELIITLDGTIEVVKVEKD